MIDTSNYENLKDKINEQNFEIIDRIIKVDIKNIYENEKNFYKISQIDQLAESIKLNGLIEPLIVVKDKENKYKIISGHRRFSALKKLGLQEIDVKVIKISKDFEDLALIEANNQRLKTKEERDQEIIFKKEYYKRLKDKGEDININVLLSEEFNLDKRQIQRITNEKKKDKGIEKSKEDVLKFEIKKVEKSIKKIKTLDFELDSEFEKIIKDLETYINRSYEQLDLFNKNKDG